MVLVHSVATEDQILTINENKFYWPKAFVCVILWGALVAEQGYLSLKRSQDPSYWNAMYADHFMVGIRLVGVVFIILYLMYFFLLATQMFTTVKQMRKAYKWVISMTVLVISASGCILLMSGRTA